MTKFRSALLAAAVLAGVPAIAFAQPPEGGRGDRSGGRSERMPDAGTPDRQRTPPQGQQAQAQAQAQPRPDFGNRPDNRQGQGSRQDFRGNRGDQGQVQAPPQAQAQAQPQRQQGAGRNPALGGQADAQRRDDRQPGNRGQLDGNRDRNDGRRADDNNRFNGNRGFDNNNRFPNNNAFGRPGFGNPGGNNRFQQDWRNDRRYDWRGYRDNNRRLFQAPRYIAPRGYGFGYRPFARGYQLQPFFYGRNYWIDDPYAYRLPPAYGPYRWVRYYNDVLLVDINTGYVVDVIQNFFW